MFYSSSILGQTKEKIDSAISNGEVVFLVVCDGDKNLSKALLIAENAHIEFVKSRVIVLDKSIKTNTGLVKKYQLSNTPTPSILVIASNGLEVKRFLQSQATSDKLLNAIPSQKQADALFAFSQNKSVFIVLSKNTMLDKSEAIEECNKSCISMQNYATIVEIDLNDSTETKYLKSLNTDFSASKTKVLVFNAKGKFIKEFEAPVISALLTNAALEDSDCPCSKNNNKGKRRVKH